MHAKSEITHETMHLQYRKVVTDVDYSTHLAHAAHLRKSNDPAKSKATPKKTARISADPGQSQEVLTLKVDS